MKKLFLRLLVGVFGTLAAVLLTTIVLNSFDEPLEPQLKVWLDERYSPTEKELEAYYFILGLFQDKNSADPLAAGKAIWQKYLDQPDSEKDKFFSKQVRRIDSWSTDFSPCTEICTPEYLKAHPEVVKWLESHAQLVKNYIKLAGYQGVGSPFEAQGVVRFGDVTKIHVNPHRVLEAQIALWASKGQYAKIWDVIRDTNLYARNIYRHGNLLEVMLGNVIMRGNARTLQAELKRTPKLKVPAEVMDSFETPSAAEIMKSAMKTEVKTVAELLGQMRSLRDVQLVNLGDPPTGSWWDMIPTTWFFRKNETLNKYYHFISQSLNGACPPSDELYPDIRCLPEFSWLQPPPWGWLVNPFGRTFTRIMMVQTAGRKKKLEMNLREIETAVAQFKK